jgi:alpha-beta hydrolase superfamily lysophospholipase
MLVNFYSSLGYVVLTYDKRGVGASKGRLPGVPERAERREPGRRR